MDYNKLLQMQSELDNHIMAKQKLQYITLEGLVLAAIVELSEATNDYQVWKHWKVDPQPKPTLLEEIADFTHFLASLSNRFKVTADDVASCGAIKYMNPSEHIIQTHYTATMILNAPNASEKQKYVKILWKMFKGLLEHLGFSEEQVYMAYLLKHKENYERQASGTY